MSQLAEDGTADDGPPPLSVVPVTAQIASSDSSPGPETVGQWEALFQLPTVAIHTHLLPDGNVLFWGRRPEATDSLDVQLCAAFVWNRTDSGKPQFIQTPQPVKAGVGEPVPINLFCSGHTFLEDGQLLVVGGHIVDGAGQNQSCLYNHKANKWSVSGEMMTHGRWYPTVIALPNGKALVASGSYNDPGTGDNKHNSVPEIWSGDKWSELKFGGFVDNLDQQGNDYDPDNIISLYPRLHVTPEGNIFMSGTLARSFFLDTSGDGKWTPMSGTLGGRINRQRDYAPAVEYKPGKILYIGGGHNDLTSYLPTNATETIDLTVKEPIWQASASMNFARRQHNAVLLPDGSVLVAGGTRGGGSITSTPQNSNPERGFNDLSPGKPVHGAELWDPGNPSVWTLLAAEDKDRCYHGTLLLLPDATVLSAGGGEYKPQGNQENAVADSHWDAQIFKPPYLFRGHPPSLVGDIEDVAVGSSFTIGFEVQGEPVRRLSMLRHGSVTHSMNQSQGICFPVFEEIGEGLLRVQAPSKADACVPGPHMLFALSAEGVPSHAKLFNLVRAVAVVEEALSAIIAIVAPKTDAPDASKTVSQSRAEAHAARVIKAQAAGQTRVTVGITPTCPYGITACWGGAVEGLKNLTGLDFVDAAERSQSVALVYLAGRGLPQVALWPAEFGERVNGSYGLRGVEVTLQGALSLRDGVVSLSGTGDRPAVTLAALTAEHKIQWDIDTGQTRPITPEEAKTYPEVALLAGDLEKPTVTVTGPLLQDKNSYTLEVRVLVHVS